MTARRSSSGVALLFIVALAVFTLSVLTREGITLGGLVLLVLALGVLVVLGVGIVGALRKPPPRRPSSWTSPRHRPPASTAAGARRRRFAAGGARVRCVLALGVSLVAGSLVAMGGRVGATSRSRRQVRRPRARSHRALKRRPTMLRHARSAAATRRLSTLGLPLGRPALELQGVDDRRRGPRPVAFHRHPARACSSTSTAVACSGACNPTRACAIASLTKMMTALLVVESTPPNAHVRDDRGGGRRARAPAWACCRVGRRVPVEPMLYGLLLPSGQRRRGRARGARGRHA